MTAQKQPELVAMGHIVSEIICFPDKTVGPVLGGPPAYSLVAAARLGTRTGMVTKIGHDFPPEFLKTLDQAGVDTSGIRTCPASTCSQLIYDRMGNKEIRFPSRAEPVTAADFSESYKDCGLVYVCTMQDDVPLDNLGQVAALARLSAIDLGGYGGVHISTDRKVQISDIATFACEAASHFHFVKASDEDCRSIFGQGSPQDFARQLLFQKTKAVLITMGSQGILVGTHDGSHHVPALTGKPVDATGGGDTFMGGFLSEYIRCGDVLQSAVFGSATALCVIEKTGGVTPERMPTSNQVRARIPEGFLDSVVLG